MRLINRPLAFSPLSLPDLGLWFDGSDASTLYDAATGGNLSTAGGVVLRWEDKSPNGWHATNSGSDPPVKSSAHPAVSFWDQIITVSSSAQNLFRNKSGGSVFVVVRYLSSDIQASVHGTVFHVSSGSGAGFARATVQVEANAASLRTIGRRLDADSLVISPSSFTPVADKWAVISSLSDWSGGVQRTRVNGGNEGSANFASSGSTSDTASHIQLGMLYTANKWRGWTGEIVVFSRLLTGPEVGSMEQYLMTKWGI